MFPNGGGRFGSDPEGFTCLRAMPACPTKGAKLKGPGPPPAHRSRFIQESLDPPDSGQHCRFQDVALGPNVVLDGCCGQPHLVGDHLSRSGIVAEVGEQPSTASHMGSVLRVREREHALAVAQRLRAGQVNVNGVQVNPRARFVGYKQSGNGREMGRFGFEEFLEIKYVAVSL